MFKLRAFILPVVLVLVVFAALALTSPVHAQDVEPPPEQPVETQVVVEEAAPPVEEPPAGTEVTEPALVEESTPEETLTDTVEALADAGAVLTDENGDVLPLTSEAAVEVLTAEADPYFTCPVLYDTVDGIVDGICRYFGVSSIQAAVSDFIARHGSGAIRVEAGNYTGDIYVTAITGLTGILGAGSENNPATSSVLNGSFTITGMTAGFTLSGFYITDNQNAPLVYIHDTSGTITLENLYVSNANEDGEGVYIRYQTGAVNLYRVDAQQNGNEGAYINTTGNVTITNSAFDRNGGAAGSSTPGLWVISTGSVTLDGVSASRNTRFSGAYITYTSGLTVRNSIFSDNNLGDGLYANAGANGGAVRVENVTTNGNTYNGITLQQPKGAVTMSNLVVSSNGTYGAYVDTCLIGATCTGNGTGNVTIQDSQFNYNNDRGIYIDAYGNISLNNVTAFGNHYFGADLNNSGSVSARTVSVTNSSFSASWGVGYGLQIYARGNVTLNHIVADGNTNGVNVQANNGLPATITMLGTTYQNEIKNNTYMGLVMNAMGAVTVKDTVVINNGNSGVDISNTASAYAAVTLTNLAIYDNSALAGSWYGLRVRSNGVVTLTNVAVLNNGDIGVFIDNSTAGGTPGVTVTGGEFSTNLNGDGLNIASRGAVSLTNFDASSNMHGNGVTVVTPGSITLNKVGASSNTYMGLFLANNMGTGNISVTAPVNAPAMYMINNGSGIAISSAGTVTLSNLGVYFNHMGGIGLNNAYGAPNTPRNVTLTNINATGNSAGFGIAILSDGAVSYSNGIVSNTIGGSGLSIDNTSGTAGVTLSGLWAQSNAGDGIYVRTNGAFSFTNGQDLSDNSMNGLNLDNTTGTGAVTISSTVGMQASGNGYNGLLILTRGAVTISGVGASSNYGDPLSVDPRGYGVYVNNIGGTGGVTFNNAGWLAHANEFNSNTNSGVYVKTNGAIAINNFHSASNNGRYGLYLTSGSATGTVSVTGRSSDGNLAYNHRDGLYITTGGAVTLNYLQVYGNTDPTENPYGISVTNTTGVGNVTVSNVYTYNNDSHGLLINSKGAISLTNVVSFSNLLRNATLINVTSTTARPVTVTNSSFNDSGLGYHGLVIQSSGVITLTNVDSQSNGSYGVYLNNLTASTPLGVNVTGGHVDNNGGNGLHIESLGAISVKNVIATGNSNNGFALYNHTGTGGVTLTNDQVSGTVAGDGIYIHTAGAVTINGVTASGSINPGRGLYIDALAGNGSVTISNSVFNANYGQNIYVQANGTITLNTVTANDSIHAQGAYLDNHTSGLTTATISVSQGTFNTNSLRGLEIWSARAVTVNGIIANATTTSNGMRIQTATNMPVTILSTLRPNEFNNNGSDGLYVVTAGSLIGSKITANNSIFGAGLMLNVSGPVTLTTVATNANHQYGTYINANGIVTITGFSAIANGALGMLEYDGLYIVSNTHNVTVTNGVITGNGRNGIRATLSGATLTVKGGNFLGNNAVGGVYDPNIYLTDAGTLVIIR